MRAEGAAAALGGLLALGTLAAGAQTVTQPKTQTAPSQPGATMPAADAPLVNTPSPGSGAPDAPNMQIPSPVLTIDQDRLFNNSRFGARVNAEYDAGAKALAAENRKIEADLTAEESALTERRATLSPEEFRKQADDFDARVEHIRASQTQKSAELAKRRDEERQAFLQDALPVLGELVRENGAVAILNSQAIFLSFRGIDVTERAIQRIDEKIGDGSSLPPPRGNTLPDQPAPDATPQPAPDAVLPAPDPTAPTPTVPAPTEPVTPPISDTAPAGN